MQTLLYVLHFIVCFILIAVVLLQRGKGQDLGASLGGGGANTIFGSRGAGNFLTRITTASAIIFMGTSLSLSYLGYKSSDVRLFDESDPFVPEGAPARPSDSNLEELPSATPEATGAAAAEGEGGLVEIPTDAGAEADTSTGANAGADSAANDTPAGAGADAGADATAEAGPGAAADGPAEAGATPAADASPTSDGGTDSAPR